MSEPKTKEKLVQAALDLFSQKGYAATGVDEIAESIGIKGPNIYKYFKGKEAFLDEISVMADQAYNERMSLSKDSVISIETAEELKAFSLSQLKFTIEDETVRKMRRFCTIEQFRDERISRQATEHQYENMLNLYTAVFKKLMESGRMKKGDPELLALEYFTPASILIQLADRDEKKIPEIMEKIEKYIDHFISEYLNG
ncbi:MAG: TetR/AcrR family transcriptional regulator [Clostridiales bacterium]|nr:TetR/AcrR family transcriptional regulator [Clostridiales bacterium]